MSDKHDSTEIERLASQGVENIDDFRNAVHFDAFEEQPLSADEKAVVCLEKELGQSPSFAKLSSERLHDLAERLYAASYQKAVTGRASLEELQQLAARRGQSLGELRIDLAS